MKQSFDNMVSGLSSLNYEELMRLQKELDSVLQERTKQTGEILADSRSNRLDILKTHKAQQEAVKEAEKQRLAIKKEALRDQIKTLGPRIGDILETADACLANDINLPSNFFMDAKLRSFGFVEDFGPADFIGVNLGNHQDFGWYLRVQKNYMDFTTGSYVGYEREIPVEHLEQFLIDFEKFETTFYAYVDKVIDEKGINQEKDNESLSERLADATSRSETTFGGVGRAIDEYVEVL